MLIGIPRETAFQENRIALTPDAVGVLVSNGHEVMIEQGAGEGSHFKDKDYSEAGARIVHDRATVYQAPILIKSAPVIEEDLPLLQLNQLIFSPIHLSVLQPSILQKMMEKRITAIAYENLKDDSGSYPIVRSMSEIAGSAVMLIAGQYLGSANHGKGVLLGGISGIAPAKVIILGAGIVGEYAARTALALGASVKVFDNNIYRLKRLQNNVGQRMWTSVIEPRLLAKQLKTCEVAVGALSSASGRTPLVVSEDMVSNMRPGSVIIDVSIDRGGCFETSKITSHERPVYTSYGVIHYCVPNIASRVARTATYALTNIFSPILLAMANAGGIKNYLWENAGIRSGVYIYNGQITNKYLSNQFKLPLKDLDLLVAAQN